MKTITIRLFIIFSIFISTQSNFVIGQNFPDRIIQKVKQSVVRISYEEDPNKIGIASGYKNAKSKAYFLNLLNQDLSEPFGSGFFYTPEGFDKTYIITNDHVIVLATQGNITAEIEGKKYYLEIVGADTFYDIAVLEFRNPSERFDKLPKLKFQRNESKLLQNVCVVAAPNGGEYIKQGKISGIDVDRTGISGHRRYIEHNALTMKGCSGSPLINRSGKVLGINTLFSRDQLKLSYALNGKLAQKLVDELIYSAEQNGRKGRINRPFLGIEFHQNYTYTGMEWESLEGIFIKGILPDSPAAKSLLPKKIANGNYYISHINDIPVNNLHKLLSLLEKCPQRKKIKLTIINDNPQRTVTSFYLKPDVLTEKNLEKIGKHFLNNYQLSAIPEAGLLSLKGSFSNDDIHVTSGQSRLYAGLIGNIRENKTYRLYASSPYESAFKYQLTNFLDLGIMVRLCSIEGRVLFYAKKGNSESVISINISSKNNARSLFF